MVAVISGSGLGLFGSSASVLGGAHGNAGLGRGTDRLYINSATGNLVVRSVDESLAALGLDISLVRTYNSQGLMDDDNGDNWRLGIHQRLYGWTGTIGTAGSTVTKVFGDGREVVYTYDDDFDAYVSTEGDGAHDTLTHSGGQWTWTDGSSRNTETYDSNGRLTATADADGNSVTYTYTGQLLTQINDSSGQQTFLDYVGTDLAAIRVVSDGQTQTLTRYYYDSLHRLRQVIVDLTPGDNATSLVDMNGDGIFETVDDEAYVTTYTYDGQSKRIASITQSDGTHVAFTYEEVQGTYRVKTYTTSATGSSGIGTDDERVTTFNYSGAGMTAEESVLSTTGVVTTTTNYPLDPVQFPPSWSTPVVLDDSPTTAINPQVVFDAQGNGVAVWAQGSDVFARRYTVGTSTWGPIVTLDTSSTDWEMSAPTLSVDRATGDAIVAWGEYNGVLSRLWTSSLTASSNTWSTATKLASWEGAKLEPSQLSVSRSGHYAALSWAQGTSSNRELYQIIYKHGVPSNAELLEHSGEPVDQVQVQIDSNGNALTVWRQSDLAADRIYFNRWRGATQAYSGPTLLDTIGDGGRLPEIKFDAQGNAFALWGQWNGLQMRRFDAATNSWGDAVAVQTTSGDFSNWKLAVDEQGNALVAWLAGNWEEAVVYARRFDAATGEWGTTASLNNTAGAYHDDGLSLSISGSNAVIAWLQSNPAGTGNDAYAALLTDGTWSTPQLLETRSEEPRSLSAAVDGDGNVSVLWWQADGFAKSVYETRFDSRGHSYTVPSGATWQSIANTLYGVNSAAAGDALRLALGNPTLTTGLQLTNLPPTLSVSTTQTQTVPAYYVVQANDTWTSITEAIYGTDDWFVVAELQELLDNPPLVPGMHLTVPLVLNSTRTHVQDALGNVTTYIKDSGGRLFAVLAPEVDGRRQQTYYDYDRDGNLTVVTEDPADLNRTTTFEYDERGNLMKTRDASGTTVTRTYNDNNQLLAETRYRDLDPDGFGPSIPVDVLTARYVYDSENHLRFTISAAGSVVEHRYNAAGQRVSTLTYTSQGYFEATATESELESFVANRARERTDYTYDFRGNLETVVVWPETDGVGEGVGTPSVTRFVYDQRGQLLQTIQPRGELTTQVDDYATTFTYDGLGRLLTTTQWVWNGESRTTINDYDDADNRTVTTLDNGDNTLVTTSLYNGVGELINVTNTSGQGAPLGETIYTYDTAGRLRITTDPVGVRTFIIYDAAGQKVGMVDGDGSLTEFVYDPLGQLVKTIEYADRLDAAGMDLLTRAGGKPNDGFGIKDLVGSLENVPGRNPSKDRITRSVFDAAGKLAFAINHVGAVVGYKYDGAGRVIEETQYVNVFQVERHWDYLRPQDVEVVPDASHDRLQRHFYDNDDKLRATLDPAGYLVEYKYDPAGRLVEQIAYATPTDPLMRASDSLDDLRPPVDSTAEPGSRTYDIRTRYFYDGRGRRVGVLDGEGYLTETMYGNSEANMDLVFTVIRHDRQLSYTDGDSFEDLKHQIEYDDEWRMTQYRYNGAGDVVKETVKAGTEEFHSSTSTEFEYDLVGRVVRTTRAYEFADSRSIRVRHDGLGRVTQELTAEGSALIAAGEPVETVWEQYSVKHAYDGAGRRISTTDQYGKSSFFYYDDDGRLAYTVNAEGEVQYSNYDALGRLIETVTYDRRISTAALNGGRDTSEVTSLLVTSPNRDSRTSVAYAYVEGGEQITTTTAEGSSTTQWTDAFGDVVQREEIRATASRLHKYIYDQRGLLSQTQWDPTPGGINRSEVRTYDAFGRVIASTDQYSNTTENEYDALGRVIAIVDPLNARRTTTYDAFSRQVTVTGATPGSTMSFDYDDGARKMIMTTAMGVKVTTQYNVHGQSVSVVTTDAEETSTTEVNYEYDANGQLTRVYDVEGDRAISEYDRAGRLSRSIDGNGAITEFHYDGANRVVTKIEDVGGLNLTTQYVHYDLAVGRLLRTIQPNGIVTETLYDRDGRLSTVTVNPDGVDETITSYQYDDVNNTTTVIQGVGSQAAERVTRYEFDALGRRIAEIIDPGEGIDPDTNEPYLNITTRYFYDANGNVTRRIDPELHSTWYVYDDAGRLRFTIDALGGVTEATYDPDNRVAGTRRFATATTAVAGWQNVNVVTTSDFSVTPDNSVDRFEQTLYDLDGRAVFSVNPMGAVTQRTFDPNGNVTREVMYNADIDVTTYTNAGDVATALQTAGANLTTPGAQDRVRWMTYDARNRVVLSVDAAGGVMKNVYDDADNVTHVIEFVDRFTGDASDLTALSNFETANATDGGNRVTRYWYDGTNRLRFTLDAEGWLKETRYLDSIRERIDTTYAERTGTFNVPAVAADADYDDLVILVGDPDLANSPDNQDTITTYDAAGRVSSVSDGEHTEYFGYDDVGNKIWFTNKRGSAAQDVNFTWRYQYDANGRLTKETTPPVEVMRVNTDSSGLHGTTATTIQLQTVLTYDDLGNVRTRTEAANTSQARITTYDYDALGRQTITYYPPAEVYDYGTGTVVTNSSLSSEIGYDTLGNAIYGRDVAGNYSHKGYDVLGRVIWELDALRHLTFNIYDAFGNVTETRRFSAPVDGSTGSADRPQIGYPSSPAVGTNDRVLVREYDRLNRVSKVIEPGSYVFDSSTSGVQSGDAIPQTVFTYNAFGEVERESRLVHGVNLGTTPPSPDTDPSHWASSYFYYDRRGLKIAEVDAERYLTRYEYDETGDVTSKTEYAAKVSSVSIGVPPSAPTATAASGSNRYRRYGYDNLNRLTFESLDINYTDFSDLNQSPSRTGTTMVSYGYDAVGNRITVTVNNATTFSYYDALGRVTAIAEPRRVIGHTQTMGPQPPLQLTPYTEMFRDAYGNVVKQIEYAGDIGGVSTSARPTVSAALANDSRNRVTLNRFDLHGRLVETAMATQVDGQPVDSNNANYALRHVAYTARGEVARQWQTIQTVNPDTTPGADPYIPETISTTQFYDALGRQIRIEEPQAAGKTRIAWTDYNAFGEVTERRMMNANGVGVFGRETFEYDRNGRLWRTNADTGVYRVYLYDIAGRATAEIKSKDLNLHDSADLDDVLALQASQLMRSESVFDLLGRVVEQRGPSFELLNSSWTVTGTDSTNRHQTVDRWGNVTQVIDDQLRITDYYYDQRNNLVRVVMPEVTVLSTGLGSGLDDPSLGLPRFRPVALNYYDRDSNLIGKEILESRGVDPLSVTPSSGGPVEQTVYNTVGQVIKEKSLDPRYMDAERKYTLDRFGQRIQSVDEEGYRQRYRYDQMGNVTAIARERGAGEFDSTGFYQPTDFPTVVRSVPTAGQKVGYEVIQYAYDQAGRRISETTGEFTGTSGNQQETIQYWYDLFGNLIRKREPLGVVTMPTSDPFTVVEIRYETTYEYDVNGKKTREVDGNGSWMTWSYDHFGRVKEHQQLTNSDTSVASSVYGATGDSITYTYNYAGLLDYQSSTFGQRIDYQYDTAGQLRSVIDDGVQHGTGQAIRYGVNRDTYYRYNSLGERVGERTVIDGLTHQDSEIEFDELGRLKVVDDLRSKVEYSYDARGNRTRVHEIYLDNTSVERTHDDWYVYDELNRVIISQGVFWQSQSIKEIRIDPTQGVELTYDARGNRATSKTYGSRLALVTYLDDFMMPRTEYQEGNGIDERGYNYDGLSRLIYEWRTMDINDLGIITVGSIEDPFSPGIIADERYYDHASRQLTQITRTVGANGALDTRSTNSTYDDNGRLQRQSTGLNGLMESDIYYGTAYYDPGYYWPGNELGDPGSYTPAGWRPGYDAAGVLRGYRVYAYPQGRAAYYTNHSFEYVLGDTYQEVAHTAESFSTNNRPPPLPGSNKRVYNINGELVSYFDPADTAGTNNRIFATNASGQVLTSVAGNNTYQANNSGLFAPVLSHTQGAGTMAPTQFYRYAGGQYIGTFGTLQTGAFAANFDTTFEPISSHYPAPAPAQVTVQTGDTLRLIAARVFGDGNLWYVLADANGLMMGPDDSLADNVGWSLRVPNEVVSITNSATTFKPFSADDALGDTTPIQPAPPPPKSGKGCGVVGMILIIVVAIVATVLTAGALAGAAGSGLSTMFATGASVLAGGAPVLGVATVGSAGAFFATAAVAGAVGSAISQGVAMAIGMQDSFSWEGVAMSAVGAGIGSAMGASGFLSGTSLTPTQTLMVSAATSNALTQGVGILVGAQEKFSWRNVATAAVSAPIVKAVGQAVSRAGSFVTDVAEGITGSLVRAAMGGKIDQKEVLVDAFGNALGNSIVKTLSSVGSPAANVPLRDRTPAPAQEEEITPLLDPITGEPVRLAANDPRTTGLQPGTELGVYYSPEDRAAFFDLAAQEADQFHSASKKLQDMIAAADKRSFFEKLADYNPLFDSQSEVDIQNQRNTVAAQLKTAVRYAAMADIGKVSERIPTAIANEDAFNENFSIDSSSSLLANAKEVKAFVQQFKSLLGKATNVAADTRRVSGIFKLIGGDKPVGALATFINKFAKGMEKGLGAVNSKVGKVAAPLNKIDDIVQLAKDTRKILEVESPISGERLKAMDDPDTGTLHGERLRIENHMSIFEKRMENTGGAVDNWTMGKKDELVDPEKRTREVIDAAQGQ